eukprot:7303122-Alexandrium_andersonii.AAC.1
MPALGTSKARGGCSARRGSASRRTQSAGRPTNVAAEKLHLLQVARTTPETTLYLALDPVK